MHCEFVQELERDISFDGAALAAGARKRPIALLRRIQYIIQNPYTSLNNKWAKTIKLRSLLPLVK